MVLLKLKCNPCVFLFVLISLIAFYNLLVHTHVCDYGRITSRMMIFFFLHICGVLEIFLLVLYLFVLPVHFHYVISQTSRILCVCVSAFSENFRNSLKSLTIRLQVLKAPVHKRTRTPRLGVT